VQDDSTGDPIDVSQVSCSRITLTSGAIHATQDLTLFGPGAGLLAIDGNNNDRVITEDADGASLAIYGVTLQGGYAQGLSGGCVYSSGPVILDEAVITGCKVVGAGGGPVYYSGGGVAVNGNLTVTDTRIVGNEVDTSTGGAYGGGIFVNAGSASIVNSTISENTVHSAVSISGGGGGWFRGALYMHNSTVSANSSQGTGGGIAVYPNVATIDDSTISGNVASSGGGAFVTAISLSNSTVAFNVADGSGAGLYLLSNGDLQSSIVALNVTRGVSQSNIDEGMFAQSLGGANDLIGESGFITLPPGTIDADPMLGPLADNGGPTFTHALLPGSPAIDAGNDVAGLEFDQRGTPFDRTSGAGPDVGAFEVQGVIADPIFGDGFDA
jgi:hypothetical protein